MTLARVPGRRPFAPASLFQLDSNTMPMVIYRAAEDVFFVGLQMEPAEASRLTAQPMSSRSRHGVTARPVMREQRLTLNFLAHQFVTM